MTNFGVYPYAASREVRAQLKVLIADITLTNIGSFEAIPIPAGFDSLEIVANLRSTAAVTGDVVFMIANGDATATNYSNQSISGTGTTVATARADTPRIGVVVGASATAGEFSPIVITMPGTTSTGAKRNAVTLNSERRDATTQVLRAETWNWESTEPITSITLRTDNHPTDLFVAGGRVQVFGLGTFAVALAR